jgi:hypothetical protein
MTPNTAATQSESASIDFSENSYDPSPRIRVHRQEAMMSARPDRSDR